VTGAGGKSNVQANLTRHLSIKNNSNPAIMSQCHGYGFPGGPARGRRRCRVSEASDSDSESAGPPASLLDSGLDVTSDSASCRSQCPSRDESDCPSLVGPGLPVCRGSRCLAWGHAAHASPGRAGGVVTRPGNLNFRVTVTVKQPVM
jgi:hypothetical protein